MATKFISAITDEAMQKICFPGGGWELTPVMFDISEIDILDGNFEIAPDFTYKIEYDADGNIIDEENCLKALCRMSTAKVNELNKKNKIWYTSKFASLQKENNNSINHHVVVPSNALDNEQKNIKTIFFMYKSTDGSGDSFLYAVAYAISDIIWESGVVQSFYFSFTVSNSKYNDGTSFIVNYTYPQTIEDHNLNHGKDIHEDLLKRDGTRTISNGNFLSYDNSTRNFDDANDLVLVSKGYVKHLIRLLADKNTLSLPDNW